MQFLMILACEIPRIHGVKLQAHVRYFSSIQEKFFEISMRHDKISGLIYDNTQSLMTNLTLLKTGSSITCLSKCEREEK